jgi:hypothetical protein
MNPPEEQLDIVDGMLEAFAACLPRESLERLVTDEYPESVLARMDELGRKANEGSLSDEEREQYSRSIEVGDILSLIRLKARLRLGKAAA